MPDSADQFQLTNCSDTPNIKSNGIANHQESSTLHETSTTLHPAYNNNNSNDTKTTTTSLKTAQRDLHLHFSNINYIHKQSKYNTISNNYYCYTLHPIFISL